MRMIYTSEDAFRDIAADICGDSPRGTAIRAALMDGAENCMARQPVSITDAPCPALSDDIHDYCSEAPYWWPDPSCPGGPYIRRDGEYNPDRFTAHLTLLRTACSDIVLLATAGFYLRNRTYTDTAARRMQVFFLDEATGMHPQMNHAQAIRGICTGRGIGIIDAVALHRVIHALDILQLSGGYDAVLSGMRAWFDAFLTWLLTSRCGHEEKRVGNNHSMWYAALVMAVSSMLKKQETVAEYAEFYRNTLIYQIRPDGGFADELTRTNSFSYSVFNLNAAATVCELAQHCGIDLWNYETADGRGIRAAVQFLLPYLKNPESWPYRQISGEVPDASFALALAASRLGIDADAVNDTLASGKPLLLDRNPVGPLPLIVPRPVS